MRLPNQYFLLFVLISLPTVIKSNPLSSATKLIPLKAEDGILCDACMWIHGAGRNILSHDLSPIRIVLSTGCHIIPFCTTVWNVVSFYFTVTPDRLACHRLDVCPLIPSQYFDEVNNWLGRKKKRSTNETLHQSNELYNILIGKTPYYRSGNETKNDVDETVLAAVRNATRAFGITDEKRIELFADMVMEGAQRIKSAHSYVTEQLGKEGRLDMI